MTELRGRRQAIRREHAAAAAEAAVETSRSLLVEKKRGKLDSECIFNRTESSGLELAYCGKVRAREGEGEKRTHMRARPHTRAHALSGDWELGQARNYMPF